MPDSPKKDLISHHIFLFPFKWENCAETDRTFGSRHRVEDFSKLLEQDWEKGCFTLDKLLRRNEFNYFYDFVRDVIYDLDNSPFERDASNGGYLDHFFYKPAENKGTYTITIPKCKDVSYDQTANKWQDNSTAKTTKKYELEVDSILLHLYSTGVGILSFHLYNRRYSNPEDILRINQFGRRIYPPFYAVPHEHAGFQDAHANDDFQQGLEGAKGSEMAASIQIQVPEREPIMEDFAQFQEKSYQNQSFSMPRFITGLFPKDIFAYDKCGSGKIYISPILDDRMFVVCWYGHDKLSQSIGQETKPKAGKYAYTDSTFWYEYAFVDNPNGKSCQNDVLSREKLETATNARWVNYSTLYGVTSYSLVALTGSLEHLRKDYVSAAFLVNHVQTLYYKLTELVLMQKACLLKFSDEITRLSNLEDQDKLAREANELYRQYLRFINKIYFREVTAQDQGIELYNLLQQQMHIERDVQGLSQEMSELHNYVMLQKQMQQQETAMRQQETAEKLTKIATLFLPASLTAAIFGLSVIDANNFQFCGGPIHKNFWFSVLLIAGSSLIGNWLIKKFLSSKKS